MGKGLPVPELTNQKTTGIQRLNRLAQGSGTYMSKSFYQYWPVGYCETLTSGNRSEYKMTRFGQLKRKKYTMNTLGL